MGLDNQSYSAGMTYSSWTQVNNDLIITLQGYIGSLSFAGTIKIMSPGSDSVFAFVYMQTSGTVTLDDRDGEAFKPVMLSSMHISSELWDTQYAYTDSQSYSLPAEGWIHSAESGRFFGLKGGTSSWKVNAPTIEIYLRNSPLLDITGWVTSSSDTNDDNVGYWAAADFVLPYWVYGICAKK